MFGRKGKGRFSINKQVVSIRKEILERASLGHELAEEVTLILVTTMFLRVVVMDEQ